MKHVRQRPQTLMQGRRVNEGYTGRTAPLSFKKCVDRAGEEHRPLPRDPGVRPSGEGRRRGRARLLEHLGSSIQFSSF